MAEVSLTGQQMLLVLDAVASHGPITAAAVARVCDINRTVAHRLLVTLAEQAYVLRGDKGYGLGPKIVSLARQASQHRRELIRPVIERLAAETGETVVVHARQGDEAVVQDQALGRSYLVRVEHLPGSRHALTTGASGWTILAHQPPAEVEAMLVRLPDPDAGRARIEAVREYGYAITNDELQLGVHGLAVPLIDGDGFCDTSIGILVPNSRAERLAGFIEPLKAAAQAIARRAAPEGQAVEDDDEGGRVAMTAIR